MNRIRVGTIVFIFIIWLAAGALAVAQAAPSAFGKVSPISGEINIPASGVTLTWNSAGQNVTYEYCTRASKTGAGWPGCKWIPTGYITSATIQSLTPGIAYYWQVRAIDTTTGIVTEADSGTWWYFWTVSSQNLPGVFGKATPLDGALGIELAGQVLSWNTSTNATSYEYCYDTANNNTCDSSWTNVGNLTSASLPGLSYNTLYYWQVRAVNAAGTVQADYSTWWSFRTIIAPPGVFHKLQPANASTGQPLSLTLTWEASPGTGITYEYCYDASQGATCASAASWTGVGGNLSAPLSGLSYATTYYWQVRAVNSSGVGYADGGTYWVFSTPIAPPGGFGKDTPKDNMTDQALNPNLTWNASLGTGITYEYCYVASSTKTSCDGTWYQAGTSTSASLSGLSFDTAYIWQVRARNTSGVVDADGGSVWHFTTLKDKPWPFEKLTPANGLTGMPPDLHLEWSASTGADTYYYCVDEIDNNLCDTGWKLNDADTVVAPAGLLPGHTYYWQVYAHNAQDDTQANGGTWWSFRTSDSIPETFSKINPANGASDLSLTPWLYWSPSTGASSYQYCINTSPTCPVDGWKTVSPDPAATYMHLTGADNLLNNTQYYWQISAVNGPNTVYADDPEWRSFTTLKAPPTSSNQTFSVDEDSWLNTPLLYKTGYPSTTTFSLVGSRPAGTFSLAANGGVTYLPPVNFNGQVTFQYTIWDGYNPPVGPFTTTINVTAVDDRPVLAFIPDQAVKTGSLVTFTVSASDADIPYGDALTYSLQGDLPTGATFDPNTGVFSWVAWWTSAHPQAYVLTVSVADKDQPSNPVQQVVKITVLPYNSWNAIVRR